MKNIPEPREFIKHLESYTPGEQPTDSGTIKLNTNEFPYPAAPGVLEAIRQAATDLVRVYPNPTSAPLRKRLAELHGVLPEQILVGNGSDEILRLLIHAYTGPERTLAMVEPTYSLYEVLAQQFEARVRPYPLDGGEGLSQDLYDSPCEVCFLPVPNPPLGTAFSEADLRRLADKPWLLVLDGAYVDFSAGFDPLALLADHPNVVIVRTFSKSSGLAGMRVGYAIAAVEVIAQLHKLRDSYNINRISQVAALAALDEADYYQARCREIVSSRQTLAQALGVRGFRVHTSQGNFVFARNEKAVVIYSSLKKRKVQVRYFDRPGLADGLRITVGTPEEIKGLLDQLDELLADGIYQR